MVITKATFSGISPVLSKRGELRYQTRDEILQNITSGPQPVDVVSSADWFEQVETDSKETALPEAEFPEDWEYLEVKGQDIQSSCGGAAMVGAAERQAFQDTGEVVRFAIWPTYILAQMIADQAGVRPKLFGGDSGVIPSYAIRTASNDGFMLESIAREHLPKDLVEKWGGDVYPRNYWNGRGSQRQFEAAAKAAYLEATRAYLPLLKNEKIRESMYSFRMKTVVPAKSIDELHKAEETRSASPIEMHMWGSSMDSHPTHLRQFPGPKPAPGSQHGHHATYIAGRAKEKDEYGRNKLVKANSWRPFKAILEARRLGTQDLDVQEWGDDGLKIWEPQAHENMLNHPQSSVFIISNMASGEAKWRKTDTSKYKVI